MVANHFHHASRTPCKLPLVKSSYVRYTVCIVDSDKSIIWIIHPSTHQEMASSDLPRSNRCWKLAKPINNLSKFSEIWKVWESTHLHRPHFNSYGLGVSVQKKVFPRKEMKVAGLLTLGVAQLEKFCFRRLFSLFFSRFPLLAPISLLASWIASWLAWRKFRQKKNIQNVYYQNALSQLYGDWYKKYRHSSVTRL